MKKILLGLSMVSCLLMAESENQKVEISPKNNLEQVQQQEAEFKLTDEQKTALETINKEQQEIAKTYQEEVKILDEKISNLLAQEDIDWGILEELIHSRYAKTSDVNISYLKYERKVRDIYNINL